MKKNSNEQIAINVSFKSIIINILLSVFKFIAGIFGRSSAMISDAVHSASDVFSTLIVIAGVKIASKESDHNHQYGHDRFECVAALILAVILFSTGIGIGYAGIKQIAQGEYGKLAPPTILALIAAVVSIIVKEFMYHYTKNAAKKINSGSLMADAWHHRTDSLSSLGSFVGIFAARMGFPVFDPIASIIICIFILKAAIDIFKDSIEKMTDEACDDNIVSEIIELINSQIGVLGIDSIKTRVFGNKIYIDVEICADGNLTLFQSHNIAQKVHDAIEEHFPDIKHCMVHVNPK